MSYRLIAFLISLSVIFFILAHFTQSPTVASKTDQLGASMLESEFNQKLIIDVYEAMMHLDQRGGDWDQFDQEYFKPACDANGISGTFQERRQTIETIAKHIINNKVREDLSKKPETNFQKQTEEGFLENYPQPLPESAYVNLPEVVVTSTRSEGPGSFSDALEIVNRDGGGQKIVFRIPETDIGYDRNAKVWVIEVPQHLFIFSNKNLIDGFSQTQFAGDRNPNGPEIVLLNSIPGNLDFVRFNGELVFIASTIHIYGCNQNWIRGLGFLKQLSGQFGQGGLGVSGEGSGDQVIAAGNKLTDNVIGYEPDGLTYNNRGNDLYIDNDAINSLVENNRICDSFWPVEINGTTLGIELPQGNILRKNFIGTDQTGTKRTQVSVYNANQNTTYPLASIVFQNYQHNNIIEDNIIAGSRAGGIGQYNYFEGQMPIGNIIRNNRIGIGANGENIAPPLPAQFPENLGQPGVDDPGFFASGIFVNKGDQVYGNIIQGFGISGIHIRDWSGFANPDRNAQTVVRDNIILNSQVGIQVGGITAPTFITNNRIENCSKGGIVVCNSTRHPQSIFRYGGTNREDDAESRVNVPTENVMISQNQFVNVGGPGIALTSFTRSVVDPDGGYQPNLRTIEDPAGPNRYQPSAQLRKAERKTDGSVVLTGTATSPGTLEIYASIRPALIQAPATDPMAYGLGQFLVSTPVSLGEFTVTVPSSQAQNRDAFTATITVGRNTSEFARTIGFSNPDPDPDTQKPVVQVLTPVSGLTVESQVGAQIAVTWTSSDNIGVTEQSVTLQGKRQGVLFDQAIATGLPAATASFQVSIVENDAFTEGSVLIAAIDAAGNRGEGRSGLFTVVQPPPPVDTVPPVVTQVQLSKARVKRKKDPNLTLSWTSSDNTAVTSHDVLYATDGGAFSTTVVTGLAGTQQQFIWTLPSTLPKTKIARVKVIARDAAGNTGEAISTSFVVK